VVIEYYYYFLYKCYTAQGVDGPFSNVSTALCQGHLETCFKTKWKL